MSLLLYLLQLPDLLLVYLPLALGWDTCVLFPVRGERSPSAWLYRHSLTHPQSCMMPLELRGAPASVMQFLCEPGGRLPTLCRCVPHRPTS